MVYISFYFCFTYIANSKTGVGSRVIFQSGKGFHRRNCLKSANLRYYRSYVYFFYQHIYPHFLKYRDCTLHDVITDCRTKAIIIM